jgi:hypothetical protein
LVRRSRRSHTCGCGCCQLASTTPPRHCDIDAHKVESSIAQERRLSWSEQIAIRRLNVYCLRVGNNWETQPCGQGAGSAFDGFCADHTWHSLTTHSLCTFTNKHDSVDHRGYVRRCRRCQPGDGFHKTKKAANDRSAQHGFPATEGRICTPPCQRMSWRIGRPYA